MNISHEAYRKFINTWWLLKLTYGLFFIWSGAHKLTRSTEHLHEMVSPYVSKLLPVSLVDFFTLFACAELVVGVFILTFWTRLGASLAALLALAIAINLLTIPSYFALGIDNLVIFVGLIALARLTTIKKRIYG